MMSAFGCADDVRSLSQPPLVGVSMSMWSFEDPPVKYVSSSEGLSGTNDLAISFVDVSVGNSDDQSSPATAPSAVAPAWS